MLQHGLQRWMRTMCPGHSGTRAQDIAQDDYTGHTGPDRPVGSGRAGAQMHIVGRHKLCRGAHELHIDIEDINSQHVSAQKHADRESRAGVQP